jgi:di/tricarboxylate transporter
MAAAIGGSAAFLTPVGQQSSTLGGYRFTDPLRMNGPLTVLMVGVSEV